MGRRITFEILRDRLRGHIQSRIENGELTGAHLARRAGLPQGHLSNFVNGRRGLSFQSFDCLLNALNIGAPDLIAADEVQQWVGSRTSPSCFDLLPRVSHSVAMIPKIPPNAVLEVLCVDKNLLRRIRPNDPAGRQFWQRFIFVSFDGAEIRTITPTTRRSATLLVDRHYVALERYRASHQNFYVFCVANRLIVARACSAGSHLVLQPCDGKANILSISMTPPQKLFDCLVGRVCQIRGEL